MFRHKISGMADRRNWGGGGDDLEESTQRMIERIWESLTDIRARMDQQAPVPPVAVPPGDGEAVPVALVLPRVEVPFAAPVPPPPPVLIAEEPVMQVEKFLRLQPPTYSGGPNPDTAEHWVHEIERVFATMRCSAADKVTVGASKGKAPAGPSTSGFGKWGQKLKQALKGKGRGWGGRPQFQQGRGRPEVEESQQSTARQPIVPPGYRCYNCNQPGHLIRNCPYGREYGYGRGVQQQQQPQQFQQPQAGAAQGWSGNRMGHAVVQLKLASRFMAVDFMNLAACDVDV
ncbi:hypothetical protein Taro_003470 [Colocasia esculenta]|uniref:CCHC-type domain-containing protein n=1 Tax=Colocasia esculenta TaxID=4460 RepID=A0A843TP02_COLES|nr:hypothetical protein [Colocasia esculenta]